MGGKGAHVSRGERLKEGIEVEKPRVHEEVVVKMIADRPEGFRVHTRGQGKASLQHPEILRETL